MKEEPMGAWEALKEGVKEGVQGLYPGLTLGNILSDVGETLKQKAMQGSAELAAALNYGNSAYVPYGQGQWMRGEKEGRSSIRSMNKNRSRKSNAAFPCEGLWHRKNGRICGWPSGYCWSLHLSCSGFASRWRESVGGSI